MSYPKKKPKVKANYDKMGKRGFEQVELILISKLKKRFCNGERNVELESFIEQSVQRLLKDPQKLNAQRMGRFESEIERLIKEHFISPKSRPISQSSNAGSVRRETPAMLYPSEERINTAMSGQSLASTTKEVRGEGPAMEGEDEWGVIMEYMQRKNVEEDVKHVQNEKDKKAWMKQELDKQIREKHILSQKHKQMEEGYYEMFMKNLGEQDAREKQRVMDEQVKAYYVGKLRDQQRSEYENRLQKEKEREWAINKELVELNKKELAMDQRNQVERKEKAKVEMDKILDNLELVKKTQAENKVRELDDDKKAQADMTRMLQKQEEERLLAQEKKDSITKARTKLAEQIMKGQQSKAVNIHVDDKSIKRKHDIESREEKRKVRQKKEYEFIVKAELDRQVKDRMQTDLKEKKFNKDIATAWNQDIEVWKKEEKNKETLQKMKNEIHKGELKSQIEEKEKLKKIKKLHDLEFAFNKKLIEEINLDKASPGRIKHSP